jgi:hypothetical protein
VLLVLVLVLLLWGAARLGSRFLCMPGVWLLGERAT